MSKNSKLANWLTHFGMLFILIGLILILVLDMLFSRLTDATAAPPPPLSHKQIAALSKLRAALSRSTEGLVEQQLSNGGVGLDFQGRFQQAILGRRTLEGQLEQTCTGDFQQALHFLGLTPAQFSPVETVPSSSQRPVAAPGVHIPVKSQNGATLSFIFMDDPGTGFFDPTPVSPIGGNPGVTRGQQRQEVLKAAGAIWAEALDSNVEIKIEAKFEPQFCDSEGALLGTGGSIEAMRDFTATVNFPGPEFPNTWYPGALANKRSGQDNNALVNDIRIAFNSDLDDDPICAAAGAWYYGLDNAAAANQGHMLSVALHELGHGLGFTTMVDKDTGANLLGFTDMFSVYTFDLTQNRTWAQMGSDPAGDAARKASTTNTGKVVWNGPRVTAAAANFLRVAPQLTVNSPISIVQTITNIQPAQFSPPISTSTTGDVVLLLDDTPPVTDGCETITNSAALDGNIALIDRGLCDFVIKVRQAQEAGAIAVLIANNISPGLPALGGSFSPTITIPSLGITLEDGNTLKAELSMGLNITIEPDSQGHLLNTAGQGWVRLYAPPEVIPLASIIHWDAPANPDLLMESAPALLLQPQPLDLTLAQMRDIGWFPDANLDGTPDIEFDTHLYLPTVLK